MDNDELYQALKSAVKLLHRHAASNDLHEHTETSTAKPVVENKSRTKPKPVRNREDIKTKIYNQKLNDELYEVLKIDVSDNLHVGTTAEEVNYEIDKLMYNVTSLDDCCVSNSTTKSIQEHIINDHNYAASNITIIVDSVSLICPTCGYIGKSRQNIKKHASLHDKNRRFVCTICKYRFIRKPTLQKHIRAHAKVSRRSGKPTKRGDFISKSINSANHITPSVKSQSKKAEEGPYKCSHCDFKCNQNHRMIVHSRTHTGEKPLKCSCCDYKCNYYSEMKKHVRIHTGEKPYKCMYCDYRCNSNAGLKKHVEKHNGGKAYACKHCDYKCIQNKQMKLHLMTHSGRKPFKCRHCNYVFKDNAALNCHLRTHTGEKPYICSFCDYRFNQSSTLKRHISIHTGVKPYKCSQCYYSSASSYNLKKHTKTHSVAKALKCDLCDFKTALRGDLKNHVVTCHVDIMS